MGARPKRGQATIAVAFRAETKYSADQRIGLPRQDALRRRIAPVPSGSLGVWRVGARTSTFSRATKFSTAISRTVLLTTPPTSRAGSPTLPAGSLEARGVVTRAGHRLRKHRSRDQSMNARSAPPPPRAPRARMRRSDATFESQHLDLYYTDKSSSRRSLRLLPSQPVARVDAVHPRVELRVGERLGIEAVLHGLDAVESLREQAVVHERAVALFEVFVLWIRSGIQPAQPGVVAGHQQLAQFVEQRAHGVADAGVDVDDDLALTIALDPSLYSHASAPATHESCSMVAHKPCSCSRDTSSSAFSCDPDDTMARPFWWTSSIIFSALARL